MLFDYAMMSSRRQSEDLTGLIARYTFANDSLDSYTQGLDGIDTNMTYNGTSAIFNGSNSTIQIPSITGFDLDESSFTFWVKVSPQGALKVIQEWGQYSMWFGLEVTGQVAFASNGGNADDTGNRVTSIGQITDGQWHFITGIQSGGNYKLFIDNIFDNEANSTSHTSLAGNGFSNGNYIGSVNGTSFFCGMELSDFRIYKRALSDERRTAIYNTEKTKFGL
jgi:hypothetical protein